MTYGVRTLSSVSSFGNNNQNKKKNILHILSISASVTRIRWRPVASNVRIVDVEDKHDSMIAVATASIKGASAGGSGVLSLWSFHRPYMPLSIVEGHKDGAVVDFDWLDTPKPLLGPSPSLEFPNESTTSRVPGVSSHESDSILYDSIEQRDDINNVHSMLWQHVISVGRDGCCLIQSLVRGDRPISRVPPSCFAMANLSPFQKGYGSLQFFSVFQPVPSGPEADMKLTGLRRDRLTANAPGIFREVPLDNKSSLHKNNPSHITNISWRSGTRLPEETPNIIFNVIDHGELDEDSNPIDDDQYKSTRRKEIVVAPEVVHLSRFADRYKLYPDSDYPSRIDLCLHNADVAESLSQMELSNMWKIIALMLQTCTALNINTDNATTEHNMIHDNEMMQFVFLSSIKELLEERANAGDVQTCVAICEVFEMVRNDQSVLIVDLEIELIREWYLSYIDLLRDMCLFSHATYIIKNCHDPFIGALNQQSTTIHESCPHCGKALLQDDNSMTDPLSSTIARRVCKSCRRRVGLCFLCHEPVKGVYVWCPGCGHGGHLEHALQWFGGGHAASSSKGYNGSSPATSALRVMCPTGCGHLCNLMKEVSAFPRTESFS